jgi:hypothetical protein
MCRVRYSNVITRPNCRTSQQEATSQIRSGTCERLRGDPAGALTREAPFGASYGSSASLDEDESGRTSEEAAETEQRLLRNTIGECERRSEHGSQEPVLETLRERPFGAFATIGARAFSNGDEQQSRLQSAAHALGRLASLLARHGTAELVGRVPDAQ